MLKRFLGTVALVASTMVLGGCGLVTRPADVYYRAGWILSHWDETGAASPHGANMCMETFCTRTDTKKKYVGGRRQYTNQVSYNYCPIHEPSFVSTGSRIDGFLYFVYWIATFLVSYLAAAILLSVPLVLLARGWGLLRRDAHVDTDRIQQVGVFIALGVNVIAWLMFAIW